jgi:hypothetical protein
MSTVRIQLRRGLASEWAAADLIGDGVVLAPGEVGFITDENTFKVGNGDDKFGDLPYILESSLGDYIPTSQFGTPSGVATLDSNGILNVSQLPALAKVTVASAANQSARLALTAEPGDIAIQADNGQSYVLKATPASTDSNWQALVGSEAVVDTVEAALIAGTGLDKTYNDAAGTITIDIDSTVATKTYADQAEADAISTASADATSKANAAQAAAEATAATALSLHEADTTNIHGIADTSALATKTYADNAAATAAAAVVASAPDALNTLNELAAALGNDASFSTSVATYIGGKLSKSGDTMSGSLDMDNYLIESLGTPVSNTDAANKSYVDGEASAAVATAALDATSKADAAEAAAIAAAALDATSKADAAEAAAIATAALDATTKADAAEAAAIASAVATASSDATTKADAAEAAAIASAVATASSDATTKADAAEAAAIASAVATASSDATTKADAAELAAITAAALDATSKADAAEAAAISEAAAYTDTAIGTEVNNRNTAIGTAVSDHNLDTTSVHGIADTSLLATKSYADTAEADAISAAGTAADTKIATAVAALTKSSVGLGNVDNTSDADKPVSTATQTALDLKAPKADPTFTGTVVLPSTVNGPSISTSVNLLFPTQSGHITLGGSQTTGNLTLGGGTTRTTGVIGIGTGATTTGTKTINIGTGSTGGTTEITVGSSSGATSNITLNGAVTAANNLVVEGDLTVNGTNFTASATSITIEDNLVQLAHQNSANTVDLGLVVAYNDGAAKHSGIVRDVSADKWKLFKGVTTEPSTTVDFTQGSLDSLQVAGFEAASATIGDVSNTELQYLNGVTSAVQTQIDSKAPTANPTFTGTVTVAASGVAFTDKTQTKAGVPSLTTIATAVSSNTTLDALGTDADVRDSLIPLSGAVAITFEATGNAKYAIGSSISFYQSSGSGANFVESGITVLATPGRILRTTNSSVTATKIAATTWLLAGDLR